MPKKPVKKSAARKPAKKAAVRKKPVKAAAKPKKKPIGKIRHFFPNISVAVVDLSSELRKGESILVEGSSTSFKQKVESMQVDHKNIAVAKKGQSIGLKVKDRVREGDKVYLVK
jgi:putative protease